MTILIFSVVPIQAAPLPTITISVTDIDDISVNTINVGEIIKVTVRLSDFPGLSIASPSLHFNPDTVKICDINGDFSEKSYVDTGFFQTGTAASGWGGSFAVTSDYYPFFNNNTGVAGLLFTHSTSNDLIGTQSLYSVYMKATASGSADIRLSRIEDSYGITSEAERLNYYDYPLYTSPTAEPNYAFYSGDIPLNIAPFPSLTVTSKAETIYTTVQAIGTNDSYCYIGDKFEVKVYIKNTPSLMSVNLPMLYNVIGGEPKVELLDLEGNVVNPLTATNKIIDVAPPFSLLENQNYPNFDYEKQFVNVILDLDPIICPNGILNLKESEPTLLCSFKFQAIGIGIYPQSSDLKTGFIKFADINDIIYDAISPTGALITANNTENPFDTSNLIFPAEQNAPFEIDIRKSKAPEVVAVVPDNSGEFATVIVTGVAPYSFVTIYSDDNGTQLATAPADANGNVVFASIPLADTVDDYIYADAIETGKTVSDLTSGNPKYPEVKKILVSLEPYETISVNYGTLKDNIPLPETKIKGKVGYVIDGHDGIFTLPEDVFFSPDKSTWTNATYVGTTSATYDFFVSPDLTGTEYENPNNLTAKQPVYVKPSSGNGTSPPGGGSGGSAGRVVVSPGSNLIINCINDEDGVLFSQKIIKVEIGQDQVINAPDLEGFMLAEGETTPKFVKILTTDTVVEFRYIKKPQLNKAEHYRYIFGYPDGNVRPEYNITREEVAAIFYRLLTKESRMQYRRQTSTFPDVEANRWSTQEIATMQKARIIEGRGDGHFYPDTMITRAEFATMAIRFDELSEQKNHEFSDINGHWAENYISSAVEKGWVLGYPDGTFRPDIPITRVEAMALINRVLLRCVDNEGLLESLIVGWPDLPYDHWGYFDVQEATISHNFIRRYPDEFIEDSEIHVNITENWIEKGEDVQFDVE